MSDKAVIAPVLGLAAAAGGIGLLRLAWRRPKPAVASLVGWALLAAALPAWALQAGWDKAWALTLLTPSLIALPAVAAHAEVRPARARAPGRLAAELPPRSGEALWRAVARTLCGGPLAGAAALALSGAWALRGAGSEADRIGVALLAAPALWAAGLIWAMTDPRLVRVGGALGLLALAGVTAGR